MYNAWCKLPENERTTAVLLSRLDFDFFEVLDSVTIARSRKHIQKYYDVSDIGTFPVRNKPISLWPKLTNRPNSINYREVFELLSELQLTYTYQRYTFMPVNCTSIWMKKKRRTLEKGVS